MSLPSSLEKAIRQRNAKHESRIKWDQRWMALAELAATWSGDLSTQCGAIIVDNRNVLLSIGWNDLPRQVEDLPNRRDRPDKLLFTEHAERNAILNAAAKGISCLGATMYSTWFPCADCARAIIQAGIANLVVGTPPEQNHPRWAISFDAAQQMLNEAGVLWRVPFA